MYVFVVFFYYLVLCVFNCICNEPQRNLSWKANLRTKHCMYFMYLCVKYYIGIQGEDLSIVKVLLTTAPPPPTAAHSRHQFILPTVPRRWSWCNSNFVWLRIESCLFLCSRVFQLCLALRSPHMGTRELVYVLFVHLFVCFTRVKSGIGCGVLLWHSLDFSINVFEEHLFAQSWTYIYFTLLS